MPEHDAGKKESDYFENPLEAIADYFGLEIITKYRGEISPLYKVKEKQNEE